MTPETRSARGRQTLAVLGLGFYCLVANLILQTVLPFVFLFLIAGGEPEVQQQFQTLSELSSGSGPQAQAIEAQAQAMRPLMERVPWWALGLVSSLLLYVPLGWFAERLLSRPEVSGLLLAAASVFGQNPAVTPLMLEYSGFGKVALPLGWALSLIFVQFVFLTVGIFWSRGARRTASLRE